MSLDESRNQTQSRRWTRAILIILVLVPVLFNAIMLLPEVTVPVPSENDDIAHFVLVRQANEALDLGANPVDFWVPQLELGLPEFLYYQHLPHLAVVLLHRLLLKRVALFTLFNLVRYLLMVLFPLTVYWSMRTMEFSPISSAIGAGFGSLISANHDFGFDYENYLWLGYGLYTQIWGMHLFFISIACLQRLITRGTGYLAAILSTSALVLCHLVYAYMMGITTIVLFLLAVASESEAS